MSSVMKVAVRVRPLNKREKLLSSKVIIHMRGNTTSIHKPLAGRGEKLKDRGKMFSYDYSFDSIDADSPTFSSQEKIFKNLGSDVLKAAFYGYNACVFAYGQTGSGKSYTMMGNKDFSLYDCIHLSIYSSQLPFPYSMMLPPPCFTMR